MPINPQEKIEKVVTELSENFCQLFTKPTEDFQGSDLKYAQMRLQMGQILYYTFLEHILIDERKREANLKVLK